MKGGVWSGLEWDLYFCDGNKVRHKTVTNYAFLRQLLVNTRVNLLIPSQKKYNDWNWLNQNDRVESNFLVRCKKKRHFSKEVSLKAIYNQ